MGSSFLLVNVFPNVNPNGAQTADRDDGYGSAFLLGCASIYATSDGKSWLKTNLPRIKNLTRLVLSDNQRTTGQSVGLITTYSKYRTGAIPPNPSTGYQGNEIWLGQQSSYLQDSCRNYSALSQFSTVLCALGDPDAETYSKAASLLATGIQRFYSAATGQAIITSTS